MSETTANGGGPLEILKSPIFLKVLTFVVVLFAIGFAAPSVFPDNEFVGVLVGMAWSLGFLVAFVLLISVIASAVSVITR